MSETLVLIRNELYSLLNSSAFSTDSIEGWIIILLCFVMVYEFSHKAVNFAIWCLNAILLCQILYWLSFTGLNDIIPIGRIFKYDLITAIAQCFVGTKICNVLLYINAFLRLICSSVWGTLSSWFSIL